MGFVSNIDPTERADLIRAYALAAEAKTLVDRVFSGAEPSLQEDLKWATAAAHDLASDLAGIVANTEPVSFCDLERVTLTSRELV